MREILAMTGVPRQVLRPAALVAAVAVAFVLVRVVNVFQYGGVSTASVDRQVERAREQANGAPATLSCLRAAPSADTPGVFGCRATVRATGATVLYTVTTSGRCWTARTSEPGAAPELSGCGLDWEFYFPWEQAG